MNFNTHLHLEGQHAFLGASKYHWINYTPERLTGAYNKFLAAQMGTRLHEFACEAIQLGIKLPNNKKTINQYVNDAIAFKMVPEQVLYYSNNSFGTADAISFRKNILRIHDLKTGTSPTSVHQLEIYAALFCLEYSYSPLDISMELRIYQCDDVVIHIPNPDDIRSIMDKIIEFDHHIEKLKVGE